MQISKVMTRDVTVVEPDANLRHAASLMDRLNVGALPVCNGRRLVGMITDRDMVVRAIAAGKGAEAPVSEAMSSEIEWCYEHDTTDDAIARMGRMQIRRIPIVDDDKNLVGIVALGDLATDEVPGAEHALEQVSEPSQPDR